MLLVAISDPALTAAHRCEASRELRNVPPPSHRQVGQFAEWPKRRAKGMTKIINC
jgi:hypothetical protein